MFGKFIRDARQRPVHMFIALAILAGILSMLGVTAYVTLDMAGFWKLLAVLVTGFVIGFVLDIYDKERENSLRVYIMGGFKASIVVLLLYILTPLLINPVLRLLGL